MAKKKRLVNSKRTDKIPIGEFFSVRFFSLERLFDQLEAPASHPRVFKDSLLGIIQMYFDGLVDRQWKSQKHWSKQKQTLDALLEGAQLTISSFYNNEESIPRDDVMEVIMPYEDIIFKYSSKKDSKWRHLENREKNVQRMMRHVAQVLAEKNFEVVIPISSGGFEPAFLLKAYLNIETIFPVRYSRLQKGDEEVLVPKKAPRNYAKKNIQGKRVLVVDDIISAGTTVVKTMHWANGLSPADIFLAVYNGQTSLSRYGLYNYYLAPDKYGLCNYYLASDKIYGLKPKNY